MHHPEITTTCAFICPTGSNEGAPSLEAFAGGSPSGLDVASLERLTVKYFHKGLANSTCCSYNSAQSRYCRDAMLRSLQVSESILCYFVVHLADSSLKHCTIMAYLPAVRFLHIAEVLVTPSSHTWIACNTPYEEWSWKWWWKWRARWTQYIKMHQSSLACCLGFFGFLRTSSCNGKSVYINALVCWICETLVCSIECTWCLNGG